MKLIKERLKSKIKILKFLTLTINFTMPEVAQMSCAEFVAWHLLAVLLINAIACGFASPVDMLMETTLAQVVEEILVDI